MATNGAGEGDQMQAQRACALSEAETQSQRLKDSFTGTARWLACISERPNSRGAYRGTADGVKGYKG